MPVNIAARLVALALAALVTASPAAAQDTPKLRPGLWEVSTRTSTQAAGEPAARSTMCLDEASAREMFRFTQGMLEGMCSKFDVRHTGDRYVSEAHCRLGDSRVVAHSTMMITGDTAYRTEGRSTYDPPLLGMKEATTTVEARHAGPCGPGQRPGDITTATGQTINILTLKPAGR
ncbi:hypothetical protein RHIZO_03974 [Rhizobiaceae bacterium]|nr:hypothetical protein RHIZO_03974 [Rhizobiaceae bacterium]